MVARARPQSSEVFLSDSSRDSFMTMSSPSGYRRPWARSRDKTNREMAATPTLSTTVGGRPAGVSESLPHGEGPSSACPSPSPCPQGAPSPRRTAWPSYLQLR